MSTTGRNFFQYVDTIDKCVFHVGLPLDYDQNLLSYRNANATKKVIEILDYYKSRSKRPVIKIGTVCTKDNIARLKNIGDILSGYSDVIDVWKIYQFLPIGRNAILNRSKLEVSGDDFFQATKDLNNLFSRFFRIALAPRDQMVAAHFLVNPNGDSIVTSDNGTDSCENMIGSLVDDEWGKIFKRWSQAVSENNYSSNIKKTFLLDI